MTNSLMGSENRADHAWDFLSSWFVIGVRFYRAGGGLWLGRMICRLTAEMRLLTFVAIDFATHLLRL